MPEIIIVTGRVNSGKTAFLEKFINQEKVDGNFPTGILARGIFDGQIKIGYDVVNIVNGISMPLARTSHFAEGNIEFGRFYFSEKAFNFAKDALLNFKSGGVVFLDEAGPMELDGKGHAASLKTLIESEILRLYIVVRQELLDQFKSGFLGERDVKIIEVNINSSRH